MLETKLLDPARMLRTVGALGLPARLYLLTESRVVVYTSVTVCDADFVRGLKNLEESSLSR